MAAVVRAWWGIMAGQRAGEVCVRSDGAAAAGGSVALCYALECREWKKRERRERRESQRVWLQNCQNFQLEREKVWIQKLFKNSKAYNFHFRHKLIWSLVKEINLNSWGKIHYCPIRVWIQIFLQFVCSNSKILEHESFSTFKLYNFGFGQKFIELCFRNYFQSIFV